MEDLPIGIDELGIVAEYADPPDIKKSKLFTKKWKERFNGIYYSIQRDLDRMDKMSPLFNMTYLELYRMALKRNWSRQDFFDIIYQIMAESSSDIIPNPFMYFPLVIANKDKSEFLLFDERKATKEGNKILDQLIEGDKETWDDMENLYRVALALRPDQPVDGMEYNKRTGTFGESLWAFNETQTMPEIFDHLTHFMGENPVTENRPEYLLDTLRRVLHNHLHLISSKELDILKKYYQTYLDTLETDYYPEILLAITSRLSYLQMDTFAN